MKLTLCIESDELRSRFVAAAVMLGADVRETDLEHYLKGPVEAGGFVLADGGIESIRRLVLHLQCCGCDPRKTLVRLIDSPWYAYVYHDLPLFASIVHPADPVAAAEVVQKLDRSLPFVEETFSANENKVDPEDPFSTDLVSSAPMQGVIEQLEKLSKLPVDTILLGETGTGKDTAAHWLHSRSALKGEFVHLNCAALPEQLFEAELFGVMAGAFTGAMKDRPGKLEMAHEGTLYLDEIDSMPLTCQSKLLNALQYRGATRLGGTKFYKSDFRVIASTKIDLQALVRQGKFREDLYFRLNISRVAIPALRDRLDDIVPLYSLFLGQAARQFNLPCPALNMSLTDSLLTHSWPGNVRELRAHAQRQVMGLEKGLEEPVGDSLGLKARLLQYEKLLILNAMKSCEGSTKKVSELLKIPLHSLYYRLKRFGIPIDDQSSDVDPSAQESRNQSGIFDTQSY